MAKFPSPKDYYQTMFDSFILAASVSCDAYLEFRVQAGIVRVKLSDTFKPNNTSFQMPNLSRPPPSIFRRPRQVFNDRTKEPPKKRLHAAIATPSPEKPSNEVSRSETNDQPAVLSSANVARPGNDVSLEVHDPVAPDTPEILRSDDFEYNSN